MRSIARLVVCLCVIFGSLHGYEPLKLETPEQFKVIKAKAEKGDRAAMFDLFRVYYNDLHGNWRAIYSDSVIEIVRADGDAESLGFFWLQKSADRGHPEAMCELANYWRHKSEAPDRNARYIHWMTKSAEAGFGRAMMYLAEEYAEQDISQALTWYWKAAMAGRPAAFAPLARAYLQGSGGPYDPGKAVEYFTQGSTLKSEWRPQAGDRYDAAVCMFELGELFLEGKHVAKDEAAAAKWFQKAGDAGYYMISPRAKLQLAELHIRGAGVPRDLNRARQLIETSEALDYEKESVLAALTEAQKGEAERQRLAREAAEKSRAQAEARANIERLGRTSWNNRLLSPPPQLAGMEAVDVYFMMEEKVAPPSSPNAAVDHNKFIPGTESFSSMRMWLVANQRAFDEAQRARAARGGRPYPRWIRGSDQTGGRVMLGWTAWVCLNDWWPEGYGYPNEGAGWCYGAATLDEALAIAYARALRALRTVYQGPIRCIQVEAGISAKPKWELYQQNKTFSDVCKLSYSFVLETPSKERDARKFGFTMSPPENPEEFPHFARVTMRQRLYRQVIVEPGMARGDPRYYGSYGLMNAPIPINPRIARTKEEVVAAGFPEYFFKERYYSDEPPAFTVMPFGK